MSYETPTEADLAVAASMWHNGGKSSGEIARHFGFDPANPAEWAAFAMLFKEALSFSFTHDGHTFTVS
jgi:hypothetical protein